MQKLTLTVVYLFVLCVVCLSQEERHTTFVHYGIDKGLVICGCPLIKEYYEPNGMIEQKNGAIWIKGSNLFARYLEKENKFQLVHNGYVNDQSIAFEMLHDLKEDREENLWVATNNNGLYRFNPSKEYFLNVHHLNRAKNTPGEGSVLSFASDNKAPVYFG